jgi:hypothetical protein
MKLYAASTGFAVVTFLFRPDYKTAAGLLAILGLLGLCMAAARACPGRFGSWAPRLGLSIGSLAVALGVSELALRLFFSERYARPKDERSLLYKYDQTFGWFPARSTTRLFTASRTITVTHNSMGFRDREWQTNNKPALVFLGDSFTWGYDVEAAERFTDRLQQRHPDWNIYNWGVSGYGTDQELLLLHTYFDALKPRAVVLVFCTDNDYADNGGNFGYGGYPKPYFLVASNRLVLQGVPVPKSGPVFLSEHGFLSRFYLFRAAVLAYAKFDLPKSARVAMNPTAPLLLAMRSYVRQRGAFFGLAIQESNNEFEGFLKRYRIPWVALSTTNRYPRFGRHWTPEGHAEVCDQIEYFLSEGVRTGQITL